MSHVEQLAMCQNPTRKGEYIKYVKNAPEDWINQTFDQFAEMYQNDENTISRMCHNVENQ